MLRLRLIFVSFALLILGFISFLKDDNPDLNTERMPASVEQKISDEDFIGAVISSRKALKAFRNIIDTSNSLFFINSDSYLCFEIGKVEESVKEIHKLYDFHAKAWPISQKTSVEEFIKKYPNDFKSVCQLNKTKEKKKFLIQLGHNARESLLNVYSDRNYGNNYREYYDQLELSIERNHQSLIYDEIYTYTKKIHQSGPLQKNSGDMNMTCYEMGRYFVPFYLMNTSYLDSSEKKNSQIIKEYGALGRSISSLGPLCHQSDKSDKIKPKIEKIRSVAFHLAKLVK